MKKIVCPKCGGPHPNCETTRYVCVNCKGPHMSLDKTCPIFLKEKNIRKIMSQDNCTYRKALRTFLNEKQNHGIVSNTIYMKSNMINSTQISDINKPGTSYSEILESSAQKDIFQKNKNTEEINSKKPIRTREKGKSSRKKS